MRLVITCHLALAIILGPVLIAAAGAAAVANLTGSQTCTPNLCIRSILNPNTQTLTYTLTSVGSSAQQGWYAVGTGREMSGATMWVVWPGPDGSSVLLSERQGFGHRAPSLSSTPTTGTFVATSSFANTTGLTATWTVPFAGTPSSAYPLVWAVNPNNYPGTTASSSIIQHTDHGEITVDLTQPVEANGAVAQYDQRGTERYATLIKAHAVVMVSPTPHRWSNILTLTTGAVAHMGSHRTARDLDRSIRSRDIGTMGRLAPHLATPRHRLTHHHRLCSRSRCHLFSPGTKDTLLHS